MGELRKLINKEIPDLKCIISENSELKDGIVADLKWETDKLIVKFLYNQSEFKDTGKNEKTFYGVTINGEPFTILRSLCTHTSFNGNGIGIKEYQVIECIDGIYNEEKFDGLVITYDHLPEWIRISSYSVESGKEEDNFFEALYLRTNEPIEHCVSIDNEDINIIFKTFINTNEDFYRAYRMEQTVSVEIVPQKPKDKNWFFEIQFKLKDLLTLLVGSDMNITELEFKEKNDMRLRSYYNYLYVYFENSSKLDWTQMLFPYNLVGRDFNIILKNWFSLIDDSNMYDTVKLLVSNFYLKQYEESIFLNYMQGLEGFHRLRYGGGYISKKSFKPIKSKINKFVAELELPTELEKSIQERLMHSYEYNLHSRLSEIFINLDTQIIELFFKTDEEKDEFIKKVKQTRNNLTHPNETLKTNMAGYSQMNGMLKILFICVLATELGINSERIKESFLSNNLYSDLIPNKPRMEIKLEDSDLDLILNLDSDLDMKKEK